MSNLTINFEQQIQLEWGHYLLRMEILNIYCVIGVFIKHAWVKPLKEKKSKTVFNGFIQIINKSKRKPNYLRVDQGR